MAAQGVAVATGVGTSGVNAGMSARQPAAIPLFANHPWFVSTVYR
jgi:hypothetical protein